MSKENKNKLVPKLRFPEFSNDEEWVKLSLGEEVDLLSGFPFSGSEISEDASGLPLMRGINITEGYIRHNQDIDRFYLGSLETLGKYILLKDDLVIGMDGSKVGKNSALIDKKDSGSLLIQRVARLRAKDRTSIQFIFQHINSIKFHSYVDRINTSGGIPHISAKQINDFEIYFPSHSEQQKIADCLSSLDDLISAENQKLETLKAHKKGLMQNLFPADGEKVPKLRFKEFNNSGEWVVKEFSNYIVLYRGSSPRPIQNYLTRDSRGVNWIKIGDTKSVNNFIISSVEERITPEGAEKSRKVNVGELILANSMSFGKTYQLAIDGYIYDGWFVLRGYEQYYDKKFLLQLLNSEYMQNQYTKFSAGGIVQNISSDIVYKTMLPHTSIKEQQKIADCLSSLDNLITAQSQKIEVLKEHKKGLMQGLFPNMSEVNV